MIRITILSLTILLPAWAQDAPAEAPKGGLQVRFVAQQVPAKMPEVKMTAGEDLQSAPFGLPVNSLSQRQVAPARRFLLSTADKDQKLAAVTLPEEGKDFIVLLVLGEKSGYEAVVFNAKSPKFKPGDVYVHNTSKSVVMGQVGSSRFVLNPRKGSVFTPSGARPEGFYDVMIGVKEKTGNRLLSTSRWPVDERVRSYVLFFDDPKRKDVDFRAVDEFVPVEKP
jgi:hypothetical protein